MELAERVDSIHAVEQEALDRLDTLAIAEAEIIDMGAEQKYKNELNILIRTEVERMSKSVESIDNDALDEELAMLDDDLSSERVDKGGAWSLFYIN